jgi:hypothetical protein
MNKSGWIKLASAFALAATLSACIVTPIQPRPYYATDTVVTVAPPPPQVEYVPVAPVYGQVWLGGFWGWQGGRHYWNAGHWDAPRPGYRYVPHAWVREGNAWRLHQGHWDRG